MAESLPTAMKDADDPSTPVPSGVDEASTSTSTSASASAVNASNALYNQASGSAYQRASHEAVPLPNHLYTRGFLQGRHSDIAVVAFDTRYNLHRLILDRAPFFTSALSGPWLESRSKEITLHPDKIDTSITQVAFELALKRLYGYDISKECDAEAVGLFAVACWLEIQDLVDLAVESILRQMEPSNLAPLIRLVTCNYYGRPGDRILDSAKAMLSRCGWEMPLRYWDGMPGDILRELVGSDGFFVYSEWDRWVLAKRLLDRRLRQAAIEAGLAERGKRPLPKAPDSLRLVALRFDPGHRQSSPKASSTETDPESAWLSLYSNPDVEPLLELLDGDIHYLHMDYEQLNYLRSARDIFGLPILPEKVVSDALWQQLALRQKVLTAEESAQELGLCVTPPSEPQPSTNAKLIETAPQEGTRSDHESETWDGGEKPRKFWIPSTDCNIVLGNGSDPVVTTSNSFQRHANRSSASMQPDEVAVQWATEFAASSSTVGNPTPWSHPPVRPVSAGGSNAGQPPRLAYTEFPPFRFSAEFPNPRHSKEKKRVYSRTVSYAGSLWNIYIQKVRSPKNVQLGVYLHRAKERETEETLLGNSGVSVLNTGSVDERIGQLEREMLLRGGLSRTQRHRSIPLGLGHQGADDDASGSGSGSDPDAPSAFPHLSTSPLARWSGSTLSHLPIPDSESDHPQPSRSAPPPAARTAETVYPVFDDPFGASTDDEDPASRYPDPSPFQHISHSLSSRSKIQHRSLGVAPAPRPAHAHPVLPPYIDRRPTIKTYFKIYSPGRGGRMLSIYESAPDRFNFSQSWGWKSSTLMLDEGREREEKSGVASAGDEDTGGGGGGGGMAGPGDKVGKLDKGKGKSGMGRGGGVNGEGNLRFMVVIGNL